MIINKEDGLPMYYLKLSNMKKLMMSKTAEKTMIYKSKAAETNLSVIGEAKEIKLGKFRTLCRLTMSIYNTSGQLIDTQVLTYTSYGANDMFYSSCGAWFSATIQNYQNYYGNPNH